MRAISFQAPGEPSKCILRIVLPCSPHLATLRHQIAPNRRANDYFASSFLVSKDGRHRVYLEATLVLPSNKKQATIARQTQIEDAINRMELPDFFVCLNIRREGMSSPSTVDICRFIKTSAAELNPDDPTCHHVRFQYSVGDWSIEFRFVPKKADARGRPGARPLGITAIPHGSLEPQKAIKQALKGKASKYGSLSHPYVIAVNCLDGWPDDLDLSAALFGDEEFVVTVGGAEPTSRRRANGFWWGPQGHRNRRVSAVLFTTQLVPWTIGSTNPVLWNNPFADKPLDADGWLSSQLLPIHSENRLRYETGAEAPSLLKVEELSAELKNEHLSRSVDSPQ